MCQISECTIKAVLNSLTPPLVLPIWWYFLSALPRAMLLPLLFTMLGLYHDRRTLILAFPAVTYVAIYSLLPHKELRFIFYAIPLLNAVASTGYAQMFVAIIFMKKDNFILLFFH